MFPALAGMPCPILVLRVSTEWKHWGEFLGTGFVAFKDREYQDFEKARKFIHQLAFES